MKKSTYLALLLALSLACSCAACGKKDTDNQNQEMTTAENAEDESSSTDETISAEASEENEEEGSSTEENSAEESAAGATSTETAAAATSVTEAVTEVSGTEATTEDSVTEVSGTEAVTEESATEDSATEAVTEESATEAAETSSLASVVDYSDMDNWAIYAEGEGDADVFFICPTVVMGSDTDYNMSMDDEDAKASFLGASKMELGIYDENAVVYVPYYKQAAFAVYSLDEDEWEPYLETAYNDVKAAFEYYLEQSDPERPLILAGFSQGGDMVIRLLKDCFDDPQLEDRLVAAYAIGWKLTKEEVEENPWVVPAEGETDTGCVITFCSEAEDITDSLLVPADTWTYSINPLNWKTDSTYADASLNKGACFTDYSGAIKEEVPNITGAYIDETRGTLKCPDINPEDYSNSMFPDGVYHLYDYQFFYRNLQENVAARLSAWQRGH